MKKPFLFPILLATLLGAASQAQAFGVNVDKRFAESDKNADGRLDRTEAEAMPRVLANFDKLDSGKTGYVTLAEIKAAMEKR